MAFWGRNRWLAKARKEGIRSALFYLGDIDRVESAAIRLSIGKEYFINGKWLVKPL